jgi:4-hydroxybenzoate polyprenyltransferase
MLVHGIAWTAMGLGGVIALFVIGPLPNGVTVWPLALPLLFLGAGLILYYVLVSDRPHAG